MARSGQIEAELEKLRAENNALKFALGRIISVASSGTRNAYNISGLGQLLEDAVELLDRLS